MVLDFIPRAQLVDRLHDGWRLIPDHEYRPDEYAILMCLPEVPEAISIDETLRAFLRPVPSVRLCSIEGCNGSHHGRGVCVAHWRLHYRKPTRGWAFADRKLAELAESGR